MNIQKKVENVENVKEIEQMNENQSIEYTITNLKEMTDTP